MRINSELMDAQLENKASDVTPATTAKGLIYFKDTDAPIKVSDGVTIHTVLTDQMYDDIFDQTIGQGVDNAYMNPNETLASPDSGTFTTTSTSYVDVTSQSVSITTTGKKVRVTLVNGTVSSSGSGAPALSWLKIVRDSTSLSEQFLTSAGPTSPQIGVPSGSFVWVDLVTNGTYTYKLQAKSNASGVTTAVTNVKLHVEEL